MLDLSITKPLSLEPGKQYTLEAVIEADQNSEAAPVEPAATRASELPVATELTVKTIEDASKEADIIHILLPDEIQEKVNEAGLEIIDARITYLAYATEIAAAMLQRQHTAE